MTGRNALCHCGSGTKYKRCCYAREKAAAAATPIKSTLPSDAFGLAGEEHRLTITPIKADGIEPSPVGGIGAYRVTFMLRRPDTPIEPAAHFDFTHSHTGTSNLAISFPAARSDDARFNEPGTMINVSVRTPDGRDFLAIGYPNAAGFLSDITLTFVANSFAEASTNAQLLVMPVLSSISALHDIPLMISHLLIVEESTDVAHRSIVAPFPDVAGTQLPPSQEPEARTLLNSYRDALNSNDPSWRFLCFARITEQLWKWQKARKGAGESIAFNLESIRIPADQPGIEDWVKAIFPKHYSFNASTYGDIVPPEARGLTTNDVIVNFIKPIRDDIAHGLFDRGLLPETKNDIEHLERVRQWLPMLRCIARLHLREVFGFP